jgi:hypothetical protein
VLREVDAHFLDKGTTAADIEIERGNLRKRLQALRIREIQPPENHYQYGLDEAALEALLDKNVRYKVATTRRYDVDSLSAIHRLRRGTSPAEFERCRYVLITDNDRVVRAARQVDERHEFPLAMMDADMAALLWVRSPAVADDLPRTQLLATVHSGMQPGGHLWSKYLDEIERLEISGEVSDDDALLLRARPEARQALMMYTLGRPEVDTESIAAVVERVHETLQQPIRAELASAQMSRETALHAAKEAQAESEQERAKRHELEGEVTTLRQTVDALGSRLTQQEESLRDRARQRARRVVSVTTYSVGGLLVLGAGIRLAAPHWVAGLPPAVGVALFLAGVAVFAIGAWRHFVGGSVRDWLRRIEDPLQVRLERKYRSRAGLPVGRSEAE